MSVTRTNLYRFSVSSARILGVAACLATLLLFSGAKPAFGTITIDGNVGGISEGYAQEYDVSFDIESGPTGVGGGKLYLADNGTSISVGFITPLIVNDNTYGATRASDWGIKEHNLMGAGDGLEGSDKWEIKIEKFGTGAEKLEFRFDYIKHENNSFNARIERFRIGSDLNPSLVVLGTSLDYNHNVLNLTQFFDPNSPINSPGPQPSGSPVAYNFASPAEDWIPEIMYEFQLQKSAFDGTGFTLGLQSFRDDLFPHSVFHMSPNKLGHHKVTVNEVSEMSSEDIIPEPSTMIIWSILGVLGLAMTSHRRRNA